MHVVGTAGHVDHGKSALVERLTGIDPDRFAEEKRRGLTIDLGFAWLRMPSGLEVGIVDVPGHERFIKNMLAGAGSISVCLFVVAANEGWMPQSAEHLCALDVLGVKAGVVALTKSDTVDAETLAMAHDDVRDHLIGSSLQGTPVVACSAVTGEGLEELVTELDRAVRAAAPLPDVGRPRLWVDRVFTISGAGTVVTGTLAGGTFAVGDEVEILGEGDRGHGPRRARVRAIQTHKKKVERIGPGNRAALNLAGLERHGAVRGDAVVSPGRWRSTARVDAHIRVMPVELAGTEHEVTEKGAHLLYSGSAETPVRLGLLDSDRLRSGQDGYARIYLRDPLPLGRGDRFVLRDAGRVLTFGGGEVLDPLPGAAGPKRSRVSLLERLTGAPGERALAAIVEHEGILRADDAILRTGADKSPGVTALGGLLISQEKMQELNESLVEALARYHASRPLEQGMPREQLRAATSLDGAAFDALMTHLDDVVPEGALVRLAAHSVQLAPDEQRARDRLIHSLESSGFAPPPRRELEAKPALLRALADSGELVRINDFYLTRRHANEARRKVREAIETAGPLTVAQIRDLLGTTRKYAVPLCEWLDQTGATRRRGDVRVLGPKP
jgi:selenocysteine-specific elongation factor